MTGCFQVKLGGCWRDFAQPEDVVLKRAYMAGLDIVPYKLGSRRYQADFQKMIQTNLASSKTRLIRPPPSWKRNPEGETGPQLRVIVPEGSPGTCIYVPDPHTPDQFLAVQVPAAAREGATILVPLPHSPSPAPFDSFMPSAPAASTSAPRTAEPPEAAKGAPQPGKAGSKWSTGTKVAAGGAAVLAGGGVAAAGALGAHASEVGWEAALTDAGDAVVDAAEDAGQWIARAGHDTGDFLTDLF